MSKPLAQPLPPVRLSPTEGTILGDGVKGPIDIRLFKDQYGRQRVVISHSVHRVDGSIEEIRHDTEVGERQGWLALPDLGLYVTFTKKT